MTPSPRSKEMENAAWQSRKKTSMSYSFGANRISNDSALPVPVPRSSKR
jgi:hypothetical protein